MEFGPRLYRLVNRKPVPCYDMLEWAQHLAMADRRVGETHIGCLRVSTVFLGIDSRIFDGPPLLFETMIFGDIEDDYQTRCSTWAEAEAMHAEAVEIAREMVRKADALINPA